MTTRVIRSVVGLALTSVTVSVILFRLNAPLAAVFELSVCAGLISVIFITTVNFTKRLTGDRFRVFRRERFIRFWYLPFILMIVAFILFRYTKPADLKFLEMAQDGDVRDVLWNKRHLDLLGQVVVLLAAALGVVVLFKEQKR